MTCFRADLGSETAHLFLIQIHILSIALAFLVRAFLCLAETDYFAVCDHF